MSDAAFRAWVALDRWAWKGDFPTNAQLAAACGWVNADGKPSASKAKRALRELEALGLVKRITETRDGYHRREGLEIRRPADFAPVERGGSNLTQGPPRTEPGGGANLTQGGGSNLTPSEDVIVKDPQDPPKKAGGEGSSIPERQRPDPMAGLTEAQRARFASHSPATQARILTYLRLGGPAFTKEAEALLRPLPPPEPSASQLPMPDLLTGLRKRPDFLAVAAGRLAEEFSDHKSFNGYLSVCSRAYAGAIPVSAVVDAYRQATGPKARNPGAVFMYAIPRH